MFRRSQVWFSNFLKNRVDRKVSDIPIKAIVEAEVEKQVASAISNLNLERIVRAAAGDAIDDDCDVDTLVRERIEEINVSDHIDYGALALEIDYDDLHQEIEYDKLALEIDCADVAKEIDHSDVASRIDCDDLALALRENLSFRVEIS